MTKQEFIAKISPYAVQNMIRTRIPASLTIAQSALESGWGNSGLTSKANNLFGIKGIGPAGSITLQTTEYVKGKAVKVDAAFRKYNHWGESISDHSELLVNGVSWNRNLYSKVIGAQGRTAANEIAAAGYATDPNYAAKLIDIMDKFNLYQYDKGVKETDEMSAEDKKRLVALEAELKELKDVLKTELRDQSQAILTAEHKLGVLEGRAAMNIPEWADPAVQAALKVGLLDTPTGGSYDFYRMLTVLNRAGLLKTKG